MLLQEAIKYLKPREEIREKKLIKKTDYDLSILNRHGARSYWFRPLCYISTYIWDWKDKGRGVYFILALIHLL